MKAFNPTKPLKGIRIADFTVHAAGPFSTHLMSMLGAECIKIESSKRLDVFRKPHPVYGRMTAASFAQVAANKKSIQINLKDPKGLELAKRVISISDVMCESFRPGVMERLGLGYEVLKKIKPDIVMLSISAQGQTGPERTYAGYAPLFGATGGVGTLTGYQDGPPVEVRHVMDHSSGFNAAMATLAALYRRKRTGVGAHVDVSAREVATSFIGQALFQYSATGESVHRQGNDMPPHAPNNVYPCLGLDKWVSISVASDKEWQNLAKKMGDEQLLTHSHFTHAASRWEHRHDMDLRIASWTRKHTREEVTALLQSVGVAAFPSYNAQDIADDSHMRQRGSVCDLSSSEGETRRVVGPPWLFSRTPASLDTWTPKMGEHNHYIFGELLGMSETEINQLIEQKVID